MSAALASNPLVLVALQKPLTDELMAIRQQALSQAGVFQSTRPTTGNSFFCQTHTELIYFRKGKLFKKYGGGNTVLNWGFGWVWAGG